MPDPKLDILHIEYLEPFADEIRVHIAIIVNKKQQIAPRRSDACITAGGIAWFPHFQYAARQPRFQTKCCIICGEMPSVEPLSIRTSSIFAGKSNASIAERHFSRR